MKTSNQNSPELRGVEQLMKEAETLTLEQPDFGHDPYDTATVRVLRPYDQSLWLKNFNR